MRKLAKSTGNIETETSLGANQTTRVFECTAGWFLVSLIGDFSSQTVTMSMCPTGDAGTFTTHVVEDATGTATSQVFTTNLTKLYFASGQFFKFTCSNGGTPDIDIFVSGEGVIMH